MKFTKYTYYGVERKNCVTDILMVINETEDSCLMMTRPQNQ